MDARYENKGSIEEVISPDRFTAQHAFISNYRDLYSEDLDLAARVLRFNRACQRSISNVFSNVAKELSSELGRNVKIRVKIGDEDQIYTSIIVDTNYSLPILMIPDKDSSKKPSLNRVDMLTDIAAEELNDEQIKFLSAAWRDLGDILGNALQYQLALRESKTDPLTGLLNRRGFEPLIDLQIASLKRELHCLEEKTNEYAGFSVFAVDIDYFKRVNDQHGHDKGDDVLKIISKYLKSATKRESDSVACVGGEEFIILLNDCKYNDSKRIAEKLRSDIYNQRLAKTYGRLPAITPAKNDAKDFTGKVSVSIGSIGLVHTSEFEQLDGLKEIMLNLADLRLYDAKRTGRNKVVTKLTK